MHPSSSSEDRRQRSLPPALPVVAAMPAAGAGGVRSLWLRWLPLVAALVALGGGLWLVHRFDPSRHGFYPRCWFHDVTGWHCPGCGTLRGLHALTQGDWPGAVRRNALVFGVAPLVAAGFLGWTRWRRGRGNPVRPVVWLGWALVGVTLLFGLLRNLPFPPFSLLAP